MSLLSATSRTLLWVASVLGAACLCLLVWAAPADAQEVRCERVTYNQRIILSCSTVNSGTGGTPTPTPTATPAPTPTPKPVGADGDETDTDDDESPDDETDVDDSALTANDRALVDRGTRGERVSDDSADREIDQGDDGAETSGTDTEDGTVTPEPATPAPVTPESGTASAAVEDAATGTAPGSDGDFVGAVDPAPSNLPVVLGLTALLGVGFAFVLAGRRSTRSAPGDS